MRIVIQRVSRAAVVSDGVLTGSIGRGLLVLFGAEVSEPAVSDADVEWLAQKVVSMRIFSDEKGLMNLSAADVGAEIMVVSQFTLFAKTRKGNRPSFIDAARPDVAIPLYEAFKSRVSDILHRSVTSGVFGADMHIDMEADGPVTIIMDTKRKEIF